MKNIIERIFIINICLFNILFFTACNHQDIISPNIDNGNSEYNEDNNISLESCLIIKGNPDIVKDCTPELTIFTEKENIVSMSFSGNAKDWSEWVDYSENCQWLIWHKNGIRSQNSLYSI